MMACKHCGKLNHSSFFCWNNPKISKGGEIIATGTNHKDMRFGKKLIKWMEYRKKWLRDNPPNHQGYYECWICGKWILAKEVTLDHVIPRSRRPDLVLESSNIKPACATCNTDKGSKVLDIKAQP